MNEGYKNLYDATLNFVKSGKNAQAKDILLQLIKTNPNKPELLHLLGVVENKLGNLGSFHK